MVFWWPTFATCVTLVAHFCHTRWPTFATRATFVAHFCHTRWPTFATRATYMAHFCHHKEHIPQVSKFLYCTAVRFTEYVEGSGRTCSRHPRRQQAQGTVGYLCMDAGSEMDCHPSIPGYCQGTGPICLLCWLRFESVQEAVDLSAAMRDPTSLRIP
jgi:hypothetical protein